MEETPSWQGKWEPDPPLTLLASCDSFLGRSGDSRVENRDWRGRTRRGGALTLVLYPRKPGTPCACKGTHPPRLACPRLEAPGTGAKERVPFPGKVDVTLSKGTAARGPLPREGPDPASFGDLTTPQARPRSAT